MRFALTAGQKGDAPQAEALPKDLPTAVILADAADDSDRLRKGETDKGAKAVIPNKPSRARTHALDKALSKERHRVEGCLAKLKPFRRVATRSEKPPRNDAAIVTLAATVLWLRQVSTRPRPPAGACPAARRGRAGPCRVPPPAGS